MAKTEDQRSYLEMLSDFKSLKSQMEQKADTRILEIINELKILSEVKGKSIAEILGIETQGKSKRSYTRGGANTNSEKQEPKYQNPENPNETWSGRGPHPKWVKECLKSGRSLADLKITDEGLSKWKQANPTHKTLEHTSNKDKADRAEDGEKAGT
ncbi:H-NS family nucleoid-associated regulatory protein [Paracoccus endophyticus]|uniref:H-NS histone family protein n=1 Tax=Paracoccus endophyticus TaxID=2233774 RepID=UPI000DD5E83F|nr:H-NS histone family protein [Paracoccus endophyticus]